jgi:hypothetical protein
MGCTFIIQSTEEGLEVEVTTGKTKAVNRMEWRSITGEVKAGTGL